MTDEQKAARDAAKGIVREEKKDSGPRTLFFTITTIVFFFLLVLSGIKHLRDGRYIAELSHHAGSAAQPPAPPIQSSSAPVENDRQGPGGSEISGDSPPPQSTEAPEAPSDSSTPTNDA